MLRRTGTTVDAEPALPEFRRLEIDEAARKARVDGTDVRLKPREFALLLELATNVGIAFSRERLLERAWVFDFDGDERTVDVCVRRLRAKIEEAAKLPPMVHTISNGKIGAARLDGSNARQRAHLRRLPIRRQQLPRRKHKGRSVVPLTADNSDGLCNGSDCRRRVVYMGGGPATKSHLPAVRQAVQLS